MHLDYVLNRIELELISDINIHLFIEKGIKGRNSYICKTHSQMSYCASEEKKSIIYWYMNNLYGFAMIQPVPYCEFNFLTKKKKLISFAWILSVKMVQ